MRENLRVNNTDTINFRLNVCVSLSKWFPISTTTAKSCGCFGLVQWFLNVIMKLSLVVRLNVIDCITSCEDTKFLHKFYVAQLFVPPPPSFSSLLDFMNDEIVVK